VWRKSRIANRLSLVVLDSLSKQFPGIKKNLSGSGWIRNLPFSKKPSVNFLQPKDVANIVDRTGLLRDPQDVTPMGLANLALDLVGEEKVLSSMLRRAVKMMQN